MVEGDVEGTESFFFGKRADDFVCDDVDDFDTCEGAVDDKVARFVENNVCLGERRCGEWGGSGRGGGRRGEVRLNGDAAAEFKVRDFGGDRGSLLHRGEGGDGFIIGAVQAGGREVEYANLPVRVGEGGE